MATMNLRISGSKTKKVAIKSQSQVPFPGHCVEFYKSLLNENSQTGFSQVIAKTKLFELVCASSPVEEILQEIRELASKDWHNNKNLSGEKEEKEFIQCLFVLYLLLDHQGHVKNAFFKSLDQYYKNAEICDSTVQLFAKYLDCASSIGICVDQTYTAGTIIHITKSLPLAAKLVLPCWSNLLQFLLRGVETHRRNIYDSSDLAAVEQQVLFSGLHILSQAIVAILQVANKTLSTQLGADDKLGNLFEGLVGVLNDPPPQLPSDTINSCAMALLLCYDRLHEKTDIKLKLTEILSFVLSENLALENSKWSQLKNCNTSVKFSLSAAMLGVYGAEELAVCSFENEYALLKIFELLSDACGRSSESSIILGGCRSIATLGKLLPRAATLCPTLLKSLLPKATDHCIVYLEHHMDSVRHATKAFLSSLLLACQNDEALLSEITNSFKNLPADSKAKFFGVAALGNHLGAAKMLGQFPGLVEWLLVAMKDISLAPHASSTLECLMRSHIDPDVPVELWCNTWIMPVISMMPCPALEPVLSKAVQLRPHMLPFIVDMCSARLSSDMSSIESTNHLKILISCLKMAKKHNKGEQANWMDTLGLQHLTFALCHSDDEVRLAALGLIIETRKSTEPLNAIELMSLLTGFKYCGDTDAPSTCHGAVSILKKLFTRLADSYRVVQKSGHGQDSYLNFVSRMCSNAFNDLFPGSSLCRRSFSLKVLCMFRDSMAENEPWSEVWQCMLTKENAAILMGCLTDTYEANKTMALDLLKSFSASSLGFDEAEALGELLEKCVALAESNRPPDCTNAACVLSLIVSCKDAEPTMQQISKSSASSCLIVTQKLLKRLEIQLNVAKKSILKASACGPMYGTLYCIRILIIIQDLGSMSSGAESELWKSLIKNLINMCFEMNATVAPIVNSSSPEGHLPMDFETDIELPDEMEGLSMESEDVAPRVTAQMVLLCAWRTVKEVSLTLGDLSAKAPASNTAQYLLDSEQLLLIGEHFTALLCETKHRGAFEQAYVGFCKLCAWLWKVPTGELPQLPSKWLEEVMSGVSGKGPSNSSINLTKLCTTRRSAGVPFIVQALITTELEVRTKPECFHKTVAMLLVLAKHSGSEGQLHALNILRALFRSAHLGEHVAPYVSEGFIVAINAFKSSNWAERNAATLLFSSLMSRVFGVKHTPGHEDLPRKNRMTGRIFFRLYPDLFGLLSQELMSISSSIIEGSQVAGSLYPVLLLLARLYPSSLEGTDSALNLLSLLEYVNTCTASPVMHTRVLAAKALVPLVEPQQASAYISSISIKPQTQNSLHGVLLQLSKLTKELQLNDELISAIEKKVMEGCYLLQSEHKCSVTKGAFIEFVLAFVEKLSGPSLKTISDVVLDFMPGALANEDNFGSTITKQKAARLWLQLVSTSSDFADIEKVLVAVLAHPLPDVAHEACCYILQHTEESELEINGDSYRLLGLGEKCKDTVFDGNIKSSRVIAQNIVMKVLEWTPENGQKVQFETRIIAYLAAIRLSKSVLESEWNVDGQVVAHPETKVGIMIDFFEECRLGPACFATLALAGELLQNLTEEPTETCLERYTAALLKCALEDSSCESNLAVAQSLLRNKSKIFYSCDHAIANSYCAALVILQLSSTNGRNIILQLNANTMGATRSRAMESIIHNFIDTSLPFELKLSTLLVWAFGQSVLEDSQNSSNTLDEEDEDHKKVFEQGDVDVTKEELKLTEAAASALKSLLERSSTETVSAALETLVKWIPFCTLDRQFNCKQILLKAKGFTEHDKHFLDSLFPACELQKLQFSEVDKTNIFKYL